MRLVDVISCFLLLPLAGCANGMLPTRPSIADGSGPELVFLEGEPGSGEGIVLQRAAANAGKTLHLAPGERRSWMFSTSVNEAAYVVAVTYSNSRGGDREVLSISIDGTGVETFEVLDTGEQTDGWNSFATHSGAAVRLAPGRHSLVIESNGGDGCVEIDFLTVVRM